MEIVGVLFTTLFSGGGAAGAATAAGGAAVSGLSALQGLGTVFGAISSIGAGVAANQAAKAQAAEQDFAAREEFVEAKETSAALKAELARTVANQAVSFAAGGVNLGSVSVGTARQQAVKDAEYELGMGNDQALTRSMARRRAAANARARGRAAMFESVVGAGQQLANLALDRKARG